MKNNLTEIVFILDASGSMAGLEGDTVGGFNSMIDKQKKQEGDCLVSTVIFSNDSRVLHDRVSLDKVGPLTDREYSVGGCTALLDAVGDAIRHISNIHKYARPEDVPEHTVFVITTDGMENASHRHTAQDVKRLISERKEKCGWEFLFLAANIDAVGTAARYGIGPDRAVNYNADGKGTSLVYEAVSNAVGSMRRCAAISSDWGAAVERDHKKRRRGR